MSICNTYNKLLTILQIFRPNFVHQLNLHILSIKPPPITSEEQQNKRMMQQTKCAAKKCPKISPSFCTWVEARTEVQALK